MTINTSIYEKGDNLQSLAKKARDWFKEYNISVPSGAKAWAKCSERRNEVPVGCSVNAIRRYGMNLTEFISEITQDKTKVANTYDPINSSNIEDRVGLLWVSYSVVKGHKRVLTKCCACSREEGLDYGTLQRMVKAGTRLCRYCRGVGGKAKDVDIYNKFDGFTVADNALIDSRLHYTCNTCSSTIERTLAHISSAEYLVCEICNPRSNFGARIYTDLGYFDSQIEYNAYLVLLKYFSKSEIIRQKSYNELFETGTKHTADFYIKPLDLVLEVTSSSNNLGEKYKETARWKLSLSDKVKFAYSLSEVEDIVRPLAKARGLTVDHSRSLLRSRTIW